MTGADETGRPAHPPVRHCPFCGAPLGWFFGARAERDTFWCEACGEYFRVTGVPEDEGQDATADPG